MQGQATNKQLIPISFIGSSQQDFYKIMSKFDSSLYTKIKIVVIQNSSLRLKLLSPLLIKCSATLQKVQKVKAEKGLVNGLAKRKRKDNYISTALIASIEKRKGESIGGSYNDDLAIRIILKREARQGILLEKLYNPRDLPNIIILIGDNNDAKAILDASSSDESKRTIPFIEDKGELAF